jgi:hypothetical protein
VILFLVKFHPGGKKKGVVNGTKGFFGKNGSMLLTCSRIPKLFYFPLKPVAKFG